MSALYLVYRASIFFIADSSECAVSCLQGQPSNSSVFVMSVLYLVYRDSTFSYCLFQAHRDTILLIVECNKCLICDKYHE